MSHDWVINMEELFSEKENSPLPEQEVITLLSQAILRHLRKRDALTFSQNKEPDRLDNCATSCLYEHNAEKKVEVDNE
ncbi:hypothetical protein [Endozoicomonas sp. Mp262]|uniref:hypothetical protein n=1 Tax=Endozoicomonas sp. Mp262 TaxID=2919499 RepID=UPI0021D99980